MGSKKTRNRELKAEKKFEKEKINTEILDKTKKRKGTALLNMCALLSAIFVIYMGGFMSKTVDSEPDIKDSTTLIQKDLGLTDAQAISSIYAKDANYVLYNQNNQLGLVKGTPAKFLNTRFYLDTDLKFIPNNKKVSSIVHKYEYGEKDLVIIYGDLSTTTAKYAEITYNDKTEKLEFESSAPFMQLVEFDTAENETATIKIFDTASNEITNELMN